MIGELQGEPCAPLQIAIGTWGPGQGTFCPLGRDFPNPAPNIDFSSDFHAKIRFFFVW